MKHISKLQKIVCSFYIIVHILVATVFVYQLILKKDEVYVASPTDIISYNGIIETEYEKPGWLTGHIKENEIQKEIMIRYEAIKNDSIEFRQEFPDSALFPYQFNVSFDRVIIGQYESILVSFYEYTGGAHGITNYMHYNIKDTEDIPLDKYLEILEYNKKIFLEEVNQRLTTDGYQSIESFETQLFGSQVWNIYKRQDESLGITLIFPPYLVGPYSAGTIIYSF